MDIEKPVVVDTPSFFEQFAMELGRVDSTSCGMCTYDAGTDGSVTDHESC